MLARCRITDAGTKRWFIRFDSSLAPDLTIAVRLDETAEKIVDYYLLPSEKNPLCQSEIDGTKTQLTGIVIAIKI